MTFHKTLLTVALSAAFVSASAQTFDEVVQVALGNYPSLMAAKAKTAAAKADIDRARSAHYPQISYGVTKSSYNSGNLPSTIEPTAHAPSVRLNIWSGGRIEADAERSEAFMRGSLFQEATTKDDVALLAAESYVNWAKTEALLELATKNLEEHKKTVDDIRKIVDVDTGRRIDLQQALVRLDNASILKVQRQTDLNQARQRMLRFWMSGLAPKPVGLNDVFLSGRISRMPESLGQVMNGINDDLPAIAQQRSQVQAAEAGIRVAKGQYSPTVDASVTRQLNTNGLPPYKQDTFRQVQMNMPLYNGGATSAQVEAAVNQKQVAQSTLDETMMVTREKASNAWQDWQAAKERVAQGNRQASVGESVVEGYRLQFRLGRRQLLDLLNIQAEEFSYKSSATTAFYDEQIARLRLLAVMGDLANRFPAIN